MTIDASLDAVPPPAPVASPIASLLTAPILPTLLRLAIPNMIAMVGSTLVAIADTMTAPMAEGAGHLLLFESASSPGFFPSLTGAIAIAQSLAAVTFALGGTSARRRLEETEIRLAAMSQYVAEKG